MTPSASRRRAPLRRRLFAAALLALVAWATTAAAVEIYRCGWARFHDPWPEPSRWRPASAHVERLRAFAGSAGERLPPGAAVAVLTEPGPLAERTFRYRWLAYLMPEQRLRQAGVVDAGAERFWMVYGTRLEDPRLEPIFESGEGSLYRIRTPAADGPGR